MQNAPEETVILAVCDAAAAQAVTVVLGNEQVAVPYEVVVTESPQDFADRSVLVVGELARQVTSDTLASPYFDYLDGEWDGALLVTRMVVLAKRCAGLRKLQSDCADEISALRQIGDLLRVAVIFFNNEDEPVMHNKQTETVLTLAGMNFKTRTAEHIYSPDRRTPVKRGKNILAETLHGGGRGVIYWLGHPDNDEQRAIITEAHRLTRSDGSQLGAVTLSYDVTDLANALDTRESYLATIAHELRTPLTAITGYLDLVTETIDVVDLGVDHEIDVIEQNLGQLRNIIEQLTQSELQDENLNFAPTDLAGVVRQSTDAAAPQLRQSGIKLEASLPNDAVVAIVDPARIRQVLDNLVSNALKYTPPGGNVCISLAQDDENATLKVQNSGPGLTKAEQARVFDRFFRTTSAQAQAVRGVGLGLTIVKSLVEAHGGKITVESELDKCTNFEVSLPLRRKGAPLSDIPSRP